MPRFFLFLTQQLPVCGRKLRPGISSICYQCACTRCSGLRNAFLQSISPSSCQPRYATFFADGQHYLLSEVTCCPCHSLAGESCPRPSETSVSPTLTPIVYDDIHCLIFIDFYFACFSVQAESRASHMLGRGSTTELRPPTSALNYYRFFGLKVWPPLSRASSPKRIL